MKRVLATTAYIEGFKLPMVMLSDGTCVDANTIKSDTALCVGDEVHIETLTVVSGPRKNYT
jgi:hypothetical protein